MRKNRIISIAMALVLALTLLSALCGVATAAYSPRTTAPADDNRYYLHTSNGGLNECVLGNGSTKSVLPNCVGYAWGRAYEFTGTKPTLSKGNAKTWYANTKDNYTRGSTPKIGAILCWTDSGSGLGHVAVVEEMNAKGQIRYSESFWSGKKFNYTGWENAPKVGDKTFFSSGVVRTFQGYIYILNDPVPKASAPLYSKVSGEFNIVNVSSGKYLNHFGGDTDGARVTASNGDGTTEQKWTVSEIGSLKHIIRSHRGSAKRVLDAKCSSLSDMKPGVITHMWSQTSYGSKHWYFEHLGNNIYVIRNSLDQNYVLTVATNEHRSDVVLKPYTGADTQKWKLVALAK